MSRAIPLSLLFALSLLAAACKEKEMPPVFRVEQRRTHALPGLPGVEVQVSDIETARVKALAVKEGGKELATGGPYERGGALPFSVGGKKYKLVVDKIDYHFTDTDYVFLYVEPAE